MNQVENLVDIRKENNPYMEIAGFSIIGTRQYQQDYAGMYSDRNEVFGIICDGMGGLSGGEKASRAAADLFIRDYLRRKPDSELNGFLMKEAVAMDRAVADLRNERGRPLKAGTTVVAAVVREKRFYWLSVGDSRIYLIRGRQIMPLTRDHNYRLTLNEQFKSGIISKEEFERETRSRQAEALISYLGMDGLELVDARGPLKLENGDILLLCSDGVYKSLDDSQIHAMVRDNDISMELASRRLLDTAFSMSRGGQDNTTAVLIACRGE